MSVELLRRYKQQNPWKYSLKYGERTPEEAAELLKPTNPFLTGATKVEVAVTPSVETTFTPEPVIEQPLEEKPKRIRKVA